MKIKTGITVYYCEHCKKKLFVKSAMEKHEKYCMYNPENFKACSGCANLEDAPIEYEKYDKYAFETVHLKANGFRCKVLDKMVYPTKAERLGLPDKFPETFANQIPMPKECEHRLVYE